MTGEGEILVEPQTGRSAIGLKYDPRSGLLFVAGGTTGKAFVCDAETGDLVADIQLSTLPSFINDVVITRDAVYFTNSLQPLTHCIPLDENGTMASLEAETIPLGGDYEFTPGAFNANGITAAPNGKILIIVNSSEDAL